MRREQFKLQCSPRRANANVLVSGFVDWEEARLPARYTKVHLNGVEPGVLSIVVECECAGINVARSERSMIASERALSLIELMKIKNDQI